MTLLGLNGAVHQAQATGNTVLYWISGDTGGINQIWTSETGGTFTPVRLTNGASIERPLATDGTWLYYAIKGVSTTSIYKLSRDGLTNSLVGSYTATNISGLSVSNSTVYAIDYNSGVYALPLAGGTVAHVITPNVQGVPNVSSGFSGVAVSGNDIFFGLNSGSTPYGVQALYHGTLADASTLSGTVAQNSNLPRVVSLSIYGDRIYASGAAGTDTLAGASGITSQTISNWTSTTWTPFDTSVTSSRSVSFIGTNAYFVTGNANIYQSDGNTTTTIGTHGSSSWAVVALPPPSYSVTYAAGSASGVTGTPPVDSSSPYTSGSSYTVLGAGSLARPNYQFYFWRNGSGQARVPGSSYAITSDTVLTPEWLGGPLTFSLTPGGPAITTAAFPNTASGSFSTLDIYVKNTGADVTVTAGGTTPAQITVDPASTCATPGSAVYVAGSECLLRMKWSPSSTGTLGTAYRSLSYGITNQINFTGTAVAAQRVPTFDTPVKTADGFTVNVTNWNSSWAWAPSVSAGAVVAGTGSGSTLPLTVSGLVAGANATVTVATTRTGYANGSGTVQGTALSAALNPILSLPVQTTDGFTVDVTNWDPSWVWTATVTSGSIRVGTGTGSTLSLTVSGLLGGASSVLTVTATRASYAEGTTTVTANAASAVSPSDGSLSSTGLNVLSAVAVAAIFLAGGFILVSLRRNKA